MRFSDSTKQNQAPHDPHTESKIVPRMVSRLERTVKQREGAGYYQTLTVTVNIDHENKKHELRSDLRRVGTGFEVSSSEP